MSAALSQDRRVRPGFVAVVQTFNSDLRYNPHVHAIASRGAWDEQHNWFPLPVLDPRSAELRFRTKILAFLRERDLIDDDRVALLLSWTENTGFSVDYSVLVEANHAAGLVRLARYLMRSPLSLERLTWDEAAQETVYVPKSSHGHDDPTTAERFDPLEFVARLLLHVAQPKLHLVRYFGAYAPVVRARRRVAASTNLPAPASPPQATAPSDDPTLAHDPPAVKERRRGWAELIRWVHEVDPLRCPRCGAEMRIIAFILDPAVLRRILAHPDAEARNPRAP